MRPFRRILFFAGLLRITVEGVAAPLPDEVRDAVRQIRTGDGVQPRPPHYLLEQTVPKAAGDPEQRRALARLLAEAAVAPDTTAAARTVLCQHLAKIGGEAEAERLRKLLDDPATAASARIALALDEARPLPPEAEAVYRAQTASPNPATRMAGLSALASYYPKSAAPACLTSLRDPDLAVGATAIRCLGLVDGAALARALPELEPARQALALAAAAETRIAAVRDAATRLARAKDETVRAAAVRALGAVGDAGSVALLAELGDADALERLHADGVDDAIRRGIGGGDPKARVALMNAAVARGLPGLTPALLRAATDAEPAVRAAALKGLGRGGESSAYPRLVALLGGTDSEAVEDAVRLMGRRMGDRDARLAPLLERARDGKAAVRVAVLRVIAPLGGEDTLALIRENVACADAAVRDAAVRALTACPDPAAVPELRKLANDPSAGAVHRTLAARALDRLAAQWTRVAALAYLDCGPQNQVAGKEGVTLRVAAGKPWNFSERPEGTVVFDGTAVVVAVSGLQDGRAYQLGFTWWDYDANGREQSVWIGDQQVIPKTALPAWRGRRQQAATLGVAVPAAAVQDGQAEIRFRREAAGNAVVGEVWISRIADAAGVTLPKEPQIAPPVVRANQGAGKRVLILTGLEHHNNWRQITPVLVDALKEDPRLEVSVSEDPRIMTQAAALAGYDCFVLFYNNSDKRSAPPGALETLKAAVESGRGLVLVHFASGAFFDWTRKRVDPAFGQIAGRVWNPQFRAHDPHGAFTVRLADPQHPILRGLRDFETRDELYTCLDGDAVIHVLADAVSRVDRKTYPLAFVLTPGKGRTFHCALGHDPQAFGEAVRTLYRRGTVWAAGLE
ncbi:MAG: HEAT repeat domain-containing protein [Kiritimatiellia bacterium]|jgi:type 1 glutamine amidotransferase/HEAT repeat protein|nr:HEAT repeat domain-containing protein [Kiritimatiellia bacterium]